jgi:hypothetical protein
VDVGNGRVTLVGSRLVRLIINPVRRAPQIKVRNGDMALGTLRKSSLPKRRFMTLVPSKMTTRGVSTTAMSRLVPGEQGAAVYDNEALLDYHRVYRGNGGASNAKRNAKQRNACRRGKCHRKTRGNYSAGRRLGVQDDARDADGEWQD